MMDTRIVCVFAAFITTFAAPAASAQELRIGRTVNGALSASDATDDRGRYVDTYVFQGEAGQSLRINLNSRYDNYLYIHGPNGFTMSDDDSGGNYNAALLLSLPETGEYRIQATSLSPNTRGSYRLAATRVDPRTMAATAPPAGTLSVGQEISGAIAQNSPRITMRTTGVPYVFQGVAGQEVEFRMHSTAYAPRLTVLGPGGFKSENAYDALRGRPSQYARVTATLPADGEYRVIATSRDWEKTGAYTLNVVDGATAARDRASFIAAAPQHAQTAHQYLENGDNDNAISYYEYALRLSPNNADWRNNLGVAQMRGGNNDMAVIHFNESLRLDPSNAMARGNRELAQQRQRTAQAAAQQEQARQQAANEAARQRRQAEESQAWGRLASGALTALGGGNAAQVSQALSGQPAPRQLTEEEAATRLVAGAVTAMAGGNEQQISQALSGQSSRSYAAPASPAASAAANAPAPQLNGPTRYSGTCESALVAQNNDADSRAAPTNQLGRYQHVLGYAQERLRIMDSLCRGEPQYQARAETQQIWDATMAACRGTIADVSQCRPVW